MDEPPAAAVDDLDEAELAALHEVELGIEQLHRAHGHLIAFHHSTGRAMDHLAVGESHLRDAGYDALADAIRDDHLPRGVIGDPSGDDRGRWSYDLLETYQANFLEDTVAFGDEVAEAVADGHRHVHERRQERDWKRRAQRD